MIARRLAPDSVRRVSRITSYLGLVALLIASGSFAEKVDLKRLPDRLSDEGLVIMEVGPYRWQNGEVLLGDGKWSKIHDGFLVEDLQPGTHSIKSIRAFAGTNSTGGVINTTYYSVVSLNRDFEVRAGKATHLGLAYLLEEPGKRDVDAGREHIVLWFDKQAAERAYLRDYYPKLAETLTDDSIVAAPYKYANAKIDAVRELLLKLNFERAMQARDWDGSGSGFTSSVPVEIVGSDMVIGDLGVVARIDKQGRFHRIETGTLDRIAVADSLHRPEWFHTRSGELLRLRAESFERIAVPAGFRTAAAAQLSDRGIALVDRRFRFLVTADGGETWQMDDTHAVAQDEMLVPAFESSTNRIIAIGSDRSYLFKDGAVVALDRASGEASVLDLPRKIRNSMTHVFETDAGLYIQTNTLGKPTALHLQLHGTDKWTKNEIRNYMECKVRFPNASGNDITALCGVRNHPVNLLSRDRGATWQVAGQSH